MFDLKNMSLEDLADAISYLPKEEAVKAKAMLGFGRKQIFRQMAKDWAEAQQPANMEQPYTVRIKQFQGQSVVGAVAFPPGCESPGRITGGRKLMPEDVVCVDLADDGMRALFTKYFELTDEPLTRPIVYSTELQASLLTPRPDYAISNIDEGAVARAEEEVQPLIMELRAQYAQAKRKRDDNSVPSTLPPAAKVQVETAQLARTIQQEAEKANPAFAAPARRTRRKDSDA